MKFSSLVLSIVLISCLSSCASSGPKREPGTCVLSAKYGGPYLVGGNGEDNLEFFDPLRKDAPIVNLKNDDSWETITCPF